jgi:hypothetical protein
MRQLDLVEMLTGANVALGVLRTRLVLILTLAMTFALFAWAMYLQSQMGAMIAAGFAVLVFLPVLIREKSHATERQHSGEALEQPARPNARAA